MNRREAFAAFGGAVAAAVVTDTWRAVLIAAAAVVLVVLEIATLAYFRQRAHGWPDVWPYRRRRRS